MATTKYSIAHVLLAELSSVLLVSACAGTDGTDSDAVTAARAPLTLAATASRADTGAVASLSIGIAAEPATPPAPAAVVGTGSAASCTEAAFTAALMAGGTVTFNCGGPATIIITSPKTVANTVTVDGGSAITLSGNLQSRLFDVTTAGVLTLQNLTLDKAYGAANGSAIANHGTLSLSHVTVSNAIAGVTNGGGAIYADGPLTNIDGSSFANDTAGSGGAIFLDTSVAVARISNSTFTNNTAQSPSVGYGGAIVVNSYAHLLVIDSVFLTNRALLGGALFVSPNGVVDLIGSPTTAPTPTAMQFNGNSAVENGGAIYNQGSDLAISHAEFSGNSTPQDTLDVGFGGAIANTGTLSLSGSVLYQNQARFGGGLFVGNDGSLVGFASIDTTQFKLNSSSSSGGGLYTSAPLATTFPSVYVTRSAFDYNNAGGLGGGLARNDSDLHIETSSFTNNTAAQGGGLYIAKLPGSPWEPYLRVQNVTVSGNTASMGGGVYNAGAGIEMYSMTIASNTGGVFTDNNGNSRFRATVLQNSGYANCATGVSGASYSDDAGNFATDPSCQLQGQSQQNGLDPRLGPLTQDPAGLTSFLKPQAGSPLIDNGHSCPSLDQIGAARIGACDVGAVEAGTRPRRVGPIFNIPVGAVAL